MTVHLIQGSPEWKAARAGSLGASQIHEALARTKSGFSTSRANLAARLVVERLTGEPMDSYVNSAMQHGIDTEPDARTAYEFYHDATVVQVGIIKHPNIGWTHASPDGLVGDQGMVEIKCPQPAQHLATISGEPIPEKYVLQMLWQMTCAGRAWCDFVSYNPSFPESMKLFVQRVQRDDERIKELEEQIADFLREVSDKVHTLRSRFEPDDTLEIGAELLAG